jgi:nickel-dependent lactate racemase
MESRYYLCLGPDKKEFFSLPGGWKPLHFVETEEGVSIPTIEEMTERALSQPIDSPALSELASGARRTAIIVDDATRPTPVKKILKVLLPLLARAGVTKEKVTFVIALGTHIPVKQEDLEARLGRDVLSDYTIVQHNAWQDDLVPVSLNDGQVVKINPHVAQADLKIGISSILPHPMAGYGGGPKIVMPGVANFGFIRDHHMRYTIHPQARAGLIKGNPFHEKVLQVARAVGLSLSINCVYNQQGEPVRIVAGSLGTAFSRAVEMCFEKLGHRFQEKVDITITSTYPHTHGHQFAKGLSAPGLVTKDTGAVLLVAPLVTPVPLEFRDSFNVVREQSGNQAARFVTKAMSKGLPFLPDKPLEFNMAMSCMILRRPIKTILVSPIVSKEDARIMGLEHANSIEEGLKVLEKAYQEATVAIFPSGGLIVPITAWE